jgi:hypothetical protein
VQTLSQFLLVDDAPLADEAAANVKWRTFQSGLQLLGGPRKPSYKAYITPIHLTRTRVRRGSSTTLFGMLRPAGPTRSVTVQIQFRARGGKRWQTRKRLAVRGPRHYFQKRMRVTSSGSMRILWSSGSRPLASRPVTVTAAAPRR